MTEEKEFDGAGCDKIRILAGSHHTITAVETVVNIVVMLIR